MPEFPRTTVRSRAPLRLGLAGGGTDLSPFCDEHGGAVLNCTIDRYAYAFISPRTDGKICFRAQDLGQSETHEPGAALDFGSGLQLHRGVFEAFAKLEPRIRDIGMTVSTTVDAPPGSGLGSSSALAVAMCEAFRLFCSAPLGLYELARLAFQVERIDLRLAGGRQDQYAATFGGVNFMEFLPDDRAIVNPLRLPRATINELEASLVICFTGVSRASDTIINQQIENMNDHKPAALDALLELKTAAIDMKQALLAGNIRLMGELLDRSWISKKQTASSISNQLIEQLFVVGRQAGVLAGKVSGAGGGGFIMFLVRPEERIVVIDQLNRAGGRASPVHLTSRGAEAWDSGQL